MSKRLLSGDEAAAHLGISAEVLHEYVERGVVSPVEQVPEGRLQFDHDDVARHAREMDPAQNDAGAMLPSIEQVRLDALVSISRQVAESSDEQAILQAMVEVARRVLDVDRALITLRDGEDSLRVGVDIGFGEGEAEDNLRSRYSLSEMPLARRVYLEGVPLVFGNAATDPMVQQSPGIQSVGIKAMIMMPFRHGGQVVGALVVFCTSQPREWTEDEIDWISALADQGALALGLGRTLRSLQRNIAVREALHTASQRLQSATDLETVIEATMDGVGQVVPCYGVTVHLLNEQGTTATIAGLWGYEAGEGVAHNMARVHGYQYPADDSVLNTRTLRDGEAFYLHDFRVEAERWSNSDAPTLRAWMSVPLIGHDRILGKITVDHDEPSVYGPEELAIVQTFAAHAASAIERGNLYSKAMRRAEQLAVLHRIGQELVAATSLDALYETLVKHVYQALKVSTFSICVARNGTEQLEVPVLIDDGEVLSPTIWLPVGGPTTTVLSTGQAIMMNSSSDWEVYGHTAIGPTQRRSESAIFAPLTWRDQAHGVMSVQSYTPHAYTQEDFQAFQTLGSSVALAMARIRSEAVTKERAAQFAALAQSARALVSNLELSEVLQKVVESARELTGGEAFLMLHNPEQDVLTVRTYTGTDPWHETFLVNAQMLPGEGVGGAAFAEQRTIVIADMEEDERSRYKSQTAMRSLVVLPLTVGEHRMGILELAWPEREAVTHERLELCNAFADHAALAIYNARQHAELRQREAERTQLLRQLLTAQEAERKRISIDLHDGPLQSLGVGLINADTLRKRAERGAAVGADDIHALRTDFAAVVDEVRALIADLRPEVLDSYGLLPALQAHARRLRETTQLDIEVDYGLTERVPAYIEVLVYRLVQEALSNVRKHAQATGALVGIELDEGRNAVVVRIADDGRGFNPGAVPQRTMGYGVGLSSMVERTESAGGTMTIHSEPGKGTTIVFQIPLPPRGAPEA